MGTQENITGHTASQGWEIGVKRTFALTPEAAWQIIFSQPVLGVWLDHKAGIAFQKNDTYTTVSGTTITITSVTEVKVIRMKWQAKGQAAASTLQIRVIPAKDKTTVSFHHEWLANNKEREAMKSYWTHVLDEIGKASDN
ncbi:SRPBCC domain-containing protein [Chitinophaga varians]|uniref:SRPBCC domain-containing protein n=1 Tax=Chitinophaga varians TaxID=2202339 RepID=A0A847RD04_9BACT|nr:SRPBCC domain-containing protein [Chitinophaga varians]NLR63930.1 SRPBCC domain-containing protein [Chitinophaga varians]